ncbi:MAG: DUF1987 domain-containing protein [Chitinophagales bacterium]
MDRLIIEATKLTPYVEFDPQLGICKLVGQFLPENAMHFFEPLFAWVQQFLRDLQKETIFQFTIQYINTSSSKCMMDLIDILDEAYCNGQKVSVQWYYDEGDESLFKCAEEFCQDIKLPFEIIALKR